MIKKIKAILCMAAMGAMLLRPEISMAKDVETTMLVEIGTGITNDGIEYTVYRVHESQEATINTVIHKQFEIQVQFKGNIVPDKQFTTTITEDNITYSGTLSLKNYFYDNFFSSKYTTAIYSGVLHAQIQYLSKGMFIRQSV